MNREIEKILREFQKHVDIENIGSDEELQEELRKFMEQYNTQIVDADNEPDVYDYLDMASNAKTHEETEKYARKALELDPDSLDAECYIITSSSKSGAICQSKLEALLKKGEAQLAKKGITREACAGDYYLLHETRPYLRVYSAYIDLLIVEGKIRKAVDACKDVLYLNKNDNMGVRYTLMGLYALLEEKEPAEALYQVYPEEDASMLLPFIALYYSLEDTVQATRWLSVLANNIKGVKKTLKKLGTMDEDEIDDILGVPYYTPFSAEELCLAYAERYFLYETLPDFIPWMISNLPAQSSRKKK